MKKSNIEESKEISKDNLKISIDGSKQQIKKKKMEPLKITSKDILKKIAYAESISPLKGLTKNEKKKEIKMSEEEKELNRKILYNMNLKLDFKRNPRYKEVPEPHDLTNIKLDPVDSKTNPFFVDPKEVIFRDYQAGCIYQIDLKILNKTQLLTSFKYIPPMTEHFAIKNVIYPKKDSSLIAPGMFAKMQIIFNATSMDNFNDEIVIITERLSFKVPIKGIRDKAALSLVNPMDCKKCFLGDRVEMHFNCKNNGGDAHFKFAPPPEELNDNEEYDDEEGNKNINNTSNELLSLGPFTVFPQEFYLYRGMIQTITVNFAPDNEGFIEKVINLICDNSILAYTLKGEGIKVDIEVKMLDGLNLQKIESEKKEISNSKNRTGLKFTNSDSKSTKKLTIRTHKNQPKVEEEDEEEEKNNNEKKDEKSKNDEKIIEEKNESSALSPENENNNNANKIENNENNINDENNYDNKQNDSENENEVEEEVIASKMNISNNEENESMLEDYNSNNDISDDKYEKLTNIFFNDTYPNTSTSRVLVLQNTSSVKVKYHWTIYDIYHQNDFSMLPDENYYSIEPEDGVFEPYEEKSFTIKFTPLNSKIYEQKLDLVIENIPFPAIKQFNANNANIKNSFTKAEPYLPGFNSSFPSYPLYSFTLKGKGKLPYIESDKSIIDLGNVYMGKEVRDKFHLTNPKTGSCKFKATKIIQKLLTKKEDDDGLNDYFNDNCLDEEVIIKNKIKFQQKMIKIPDDSNDKNECKTNLSYSDVQYLNINTSENNLVEYILKNQPNMSGTNSTNRIDDTMMKLKKKKGSINSTRISKRLSKKNSNDNQNISNINNDNNNSIAFSNETGNCHIISLPINQYIQINQNQSIEFELIFKGEKLGIFKSTIIFMLEDGKTLSIDIIANVIGPKLVINKSFIDFGLFPVSAVQTSEFDIENISPIPLTYLIKEQRYKNVNFNNINKSNYKSEFQGELSQKDLTYKNKIESLIDYDNLYMNNYDIMKTDSYKLKFSSVYGELQPYETKTIKVTFFSPYPIHIIDEKNTIEVKVKNSENSYVNFTAQCEEAFAYIENVYIIPKEIFLTMPIVHNNNTITINNPSNLPIHFQWINRFEADKLTAEFEPNEGDVQPHSKVDIKYKIIYFFIDHIDDLFVCKIDQMNIPLGVILQGDVIGLDIAYELTEESYELIDAINNSTGLNMTTIKFDSKDQSKSKQDEENEENKKQKERQRQKRKTMLLAKGDTSGKIENNGVIDYTLKNFNIKNLKVNSPAELFFKIKNLSGIPTQFNLAVANYPPGKEKVVAKDKNQTATSITTLSKISRKSQKTKNKNFKIDHPLLTPAHEEINFTSPKGQEFTKMKQIEKDSILYLSSNKGLAIVIEPKKGKLDAHGEITIKISFFNECVGEFHDILSSNIKGLPTVTFPIDLKIKGNPLQLSPFQPGINYLLDPALLQMGNILRNVGKLTKNVRLVNIGTNTIGLNWKIYDYNDYLKPGNRNIVDIKISEKTIGNFSLDIKGVPPEEFDVPGKYFSISPESAVVGPKGSYDFTVSFKTDTEGEKNSLFIAYPFVEGDTERKVQFNELPLKVMGNGLVPHLTVNKNPSMEGEYVYKFIAHSYGIHPKIKRPVILINKEKINLIVKLTVEGPFRIERTDPYEASMGNSLYNIIPNSNLKIDIKFLCPNPQNEEDWPMTLINVREGKLIVEYENGEVEYFVLKAILKRPRLLISFTGNESVYSLDYIDFGYVNCASKKIENIYLMNETDVDTNWEIKYIKFISPKIYGHGTMTKFEKEDRDMLDDNSVFDFDVTGGVMYGPTSLLTNLPIAPALPEVEVEKNKKYKPFVIKCIFRPKKNVFYKCRYRIVTSTGNNIDFILKGFGSYLEEHIIE